MSDYVTNFDVIGTDGKMKNVLVRDSEAQSNINSLKSSFDDFKKEIKNYTKNLTPILYEPYCHCGEGFNENGEITHGVQASTIYNGILYLIFIPRNEGTTCYLYKYNMSNNTATKSSFTCDSHINDCAYDGKGNLLLVFSSGNHQNKIGILNTSTSVLTYSRSNLSTVVSSICKKDNYYILSSPSFNYYKWDGNTNAIILSTITINKGAASEYLFTQGMYSDDNFIYHSCCSWVDNANLSIIIRLEYNSQTNEMEYVNKYYIPSMFEIEGIFSYNSEYYCVMRTSNKALIYKIYLYNNFSRGLSLYNTWDISHYRSATNNYIYIGAFKEYGLCDGTEANPFPMYNLITDLLYSHFYQTIIVCKGNHRHETISLGNKKSRVYIEIEGGTQWKAMNIWYCDDVVVTSSNDTDFALYEQSLIQNCITVDIRHAHLYNNGNFNVNEIQRMVFRNLDAEPDIKEVITANYSNIQIYGILGVNLNAGSTYLNLTGGCTLLAERNTSHAENIRKCNCNTDNNVIKRPWVIASYRGTIKELRLSGIYYFEGSCAITDGPSGYTASFSLELKYFNAGYLMQIARKAGNPKGFIRIISIYDDSIVTDWTAY
jgi:hypothetical protein